MQKRITGLFRSNLLLVVISCFLLWSCSGDPQPKTDKQGTDNGDAVQGMPLVPEFTSILPHEAHQLLQDRKDLLIVDVRSAKEIELVRIPQSTFVSLGDIAQNTAKIPQDRPVLLVCAVGGRSYAAGLYLNQRGYLQVYNLRGGIKGWQQAGFPVEYGQQ